MATKVIDLTQKLENPFTGEPLTFELRDEEGEQVEEITSLGGFIRLYAERAQRFYALTNNGKPMPFEWSERAISIGLALRAADGFLEIDVADHTWLLKIATDYGTMVNGSSAAVVKNAIERVVEPEPPPPPKKEVAQSKGSGEGAADEPT